MVRSPGSAPIATAFALLAATVGLVGAACGDVVQGLLPLPDLPQPPRPEVASSDLADADPEDAVSPPEAVVAACGGDDDCDHLDDCCYRGWCLNGTCQVRYLRDCCAYEGPCATASALQSAECAETCAEDGCRKTLELPEAGCGATLWRYAPGDAGDAGEAALTFEDTAPEDQVAWHPTTRRGLAGAPSLHAGDLRCPTYHTGPLDAACAPLSPDGAAPVSIAFSTPPVELPADVPAVARIWLWVDLEEGGPSASATAFDGLEVRLVAATGSQTAAFSTRDDPLPYRQWTPVLIDLSEHAGLSVALSLSFDTLDGVDNDHEGVYVGGIEIWTPCATDRTCPPDAPCGVGQVTPVFPIADSLCTTAPPDPAVSCEPCTIAAGCSAPDVCDVAACTESRCVVQRELTATCCTPEDAWPGPASFEAPLGDDWLFDPPPAGAGWHVSDLRAHTGAFALRFGRLDGPGLAAPGESAAGLVRSPVFLVPPDAPVLRFALWMATEWDAAPSTVNPAGLDLLSVEIALAHVPAPPAILWTSSAVGGTTAGTWQAIEVSLNAFAGLQVTVGFRFGTGDETANDGEGIYVDDVEAVRACPPCPPEDPECGPGGRTTGR